MNKQLSILITGANGFTGQHACKYFQAKGYHVIPVLRRRENKVNKDDVEYCDLYDKNEIFMLINKTKPDFFLHLAGQNHVGKSWIDPIDTIELNAMSTAYLLHSLYQIAPKCRILIIGSSLQCDLQNLSNLSHPYSLSKTLQNIIAQSWAVLYKMPIMIANPSNLIGPGNSNGVCSIFTKKILRLQGSKKDHLIEVNNVNATRDFIDVRDAVAAYESILLYGKPAEVYDVTSGKAHSLGYILQLLQTITSIEFTIKSLSNDQNDEVSTFPPSKLQNLGWKQSISLQKSLEDMVEYDKKFQNNN